MRNRSSGAPARLALVIDDIVLRTRADRRPGAVRHATLRFASVLLTGLSTGVFFGTRASLGPSMKTFDAATYVQVQQATVRNLRPVMGVLLPAAVAVNAAVLVAAAPRRRSRDFALTSIALAGQLFSLALTAAVELPINAQVVTWSPDQPPAGWEGVRDRWNLVHTVRTATSVAALASLAAAVVPGAASAGAPLTGAVGAAAKGVRR